MLVSLRGVNSGMSDPLMTRLWPNYSKKRNHLQRRAVTVLELLKFIPVLLHWRRDFNPRTNGDALKTKVNSSTELVLYKKNQEADGGPVHALLQQRAPSPQNKLLNEFITWG